VACGLARSRHNVDVTTRQVPPRSDAIRQVPYEHPDVARLVEDLQSVYVSIYGGPDGTPVAPGEFEAPGGAFFVAYAAGEPVAIGGWRRLDPGTSGVPGERPVEIKRMYVVERARGRGYARAMLAHLETTAAAQRSDWAVLMTGAPQRDAIALYRRSGYADVPAFGHYACAPGAIHLGKRLTP
jgi:GNAT superfamily N-acetyltransferase